MVLGVWAGLLLVGVGVGSCIVGACLIACSVHERCIPCTVHASFMHCLCINDRKTKSAIMQGKWGGGPSDHGFCGPIWPRPFAFLYSASQNF